jgi:iron complex outermembrane recepter protein
MKRSRSFAMLYAMSALGAGVTFTAHAQDSDRRSGGLGLQLEEVVVTAQRREEFLQDVPVSMTVFTQRQLDNANIINAGDLATYTPSLQTNNRFGADNTTFNIRGFSQELRTTASVGVYFADVVALRGGNMTSSGDGAGPGDFFDLANVQVLKGPTGTLFGRNTTGGAILITPQRPTDKFEGYVQGSAGDYDMLGGQAVVNIPVSDGFALRLGADTQQRDGYLNNISDIGPDDFADVDYTAYRASALWNITDSLENYTILRYSESDNNGYPGSLLGCNPAGAQLYPYCQADLERRQAAGNLDFYDISNFVPHPVNEQETSHVINTTTWELNDSLTFKNILAYGTLETKQRTNVFGTDWQAAGAPLVFQMVGFNSNLPITDQETFVEEFQVQGDSFDERLVWQAGLYYESSEPGSDYGSQSAAMISCDQISIESANPADFRCNNLSGFGNVVVASGGAEYTNKAAYAQGTYELTDAFSLTAGLRYTDDETEGEITDHIYNFPIVAPNTYAPYSRVVTETRSPSTSSTEPTWMFGVDYKPTDDAMLYAKYTRGYRQGSVNLGGTTGLDVHGPETVDTYEIGSKLSFTGTMPATLNLAAFYNDFEDQQVQYGYFKPTLVGTPGIANAGSSTIWGIEAEGNLQVTENFLLSASYTYLDTEVEKLEWPVLPPGTSIIAPSYTTAEGEPLSFAPENKLALSAAYLLPIPADIGEMTLSATYVYTDEMQATSQESSAYATMPDYDLVNFNLNWTGVFGSPVDLSAFVTNATDEEYTTFIAGVWSNGGEYSQVGIPRMYGARIRYNFGG